MSWFKCLGSGQHSSVLYSEVKNLRKTGTAAAQVVCRGFGSEWSWREGIPMKNPLTTPARTELNEILREHRVSDRDSYFFHLRWNAAFQVPGLSTPTICCLFWAFSLRGRVSERGKPFRESKWKHSATAKTASIFSWNYLKWCNGTVIGFHWQENHRYTHTRSQGCGRDAPR